MDQRSPSTIMGSLATLDTSASVYQPSQLLNWMYLSLADNTPVQNSQSLYSDTAWTGSSTQAVNTVSTVTSLLKTANMYNGVNLNGLTDPWTANLSTQTANTLNAVSTKYTRQFYIFANYSSLPGNPFCVLRNGYDLHKAYVLKPPCAGNKNEYLINFIVNSDILSANLTV